MVISKETYTSSEFGQVRDWKDALELVGRRVAELDEEVNRRIDAKMPKNAISRGLLPEGHIHRFTAVGGLPPYDYVIDDSYIGPAGQQFTLSTGQIVRVYATIDASMAHAAGLAASSHRSFLLCPGTYSERVARTPPSGANWDIVGIGSGEVIWTTSANTQTLFSLGSLAGSSRVNISGIHYTLGTNTACVGVTSDANYAGSIRDCHITTGGASGTGGTASYGIIHYNPTAVTVEDCGFTGSGNGIGNQSGITTATNMSVKGNRFTCGIGVLLGQANDVNIGNNFFSCSSHDIDQYNGANRVTLTGNSFKTGVRFNGLVLVATTVVGNGFNVATGLIGLDFGDITSNSDGFTIVGNSFDGTGTAIGIRLDAQMRSGVVSNNTFDSGFTAGNEITGAGGANLDVFHNVSQSGALVDQGAPVGHLPAAGTAAIVVKEDNTIVSAGAATIDFSDTDTAIGVGTTVTGVVPTQEVDVNLSLYALLGGRATDQKIIGKSTAAAGNLTLQGGNVANTAASRIIINDDLKFSTVTSVMRNNADQLIIGQVNGVPDVYFAGRAYGVGGLALGAVGGPFVKIDQTSAANTVTWQGPLQTKSTGPAVDTYDTVLRDRTALTCFSVNSALQNIRVDNGFTFEAANKIGTLQIYKDDTTAMLIVKTATTPVKTGTGTGTFTLPEFPYTATAGNVSYRLEIDTAGDDTTATYRWSDTGGAVWNASLVPLTNDGGSRTSGLQFGVKVLAGIGTYVLGDRWDWTVVGTTNQVELLRADTTNDVLRLRNVDFSVSTATFPHPLTGSFTYTGGVGTPNYISFGSLNLIMANTSTIGQIGSALDLTMTAARSNAAGNMTTSTVTAKVASTAAQAGAWAQHSCFTVQDSNGFFGTPPVDLIGYDVGLSFPTGVTNFIGFRIFGFGVGATNKYGFWQIGTGGNNIFQSPTLVGQNAPATNSIFEVSGGTVSPAAGATAQIELVSGTLNKAGSGTHAVFAGLRVNAPTIGAGAATLSDSATVYIPAAPSVGTRQWGLFVDAGNVRFDDQVAVGSATVTTGTRLTVATWPALGAGTHNLIQVTLSGNQSAAATTKRGFGFSQVYDLNGNTLTDWVGLYSAPTIKDGMTVGGTLLTNYAAFQGQVAQTPGTEAGITDSAAFWALAPIMSSAAATAIVTHRGFYARNQGSDGITTSVGMDIEAQSGSATASIGARIALATTYALQLSDTGGTAAGGITFGTDTNLYRSAANRLKTDDALMVVGNVGFNNQTPAAMQTYAASNVTTDRTYDANATTIDEVADVLGTLIADLRTVGLVG